MPSHRVILSLFALPLLIARGEAQAGPAARCYTLTYHYLGYFDRDFRPGHHGEVNVSDTSTLVRDRGSDPVADSVALKNASFTNSYRVEAGSDSVNATHSNGFEIWHYSFALRGDSLFGIAEYMVDSDLMVALVATTRGTKVKCW